jgi:hypothetical protein
MVSKFIKHAGREMITFGTEIEIMIPRDDVSMYQYSENVYSFQPLSGTVYYFMVPQKTHLITHPH